MYRTLLFLFILLFVSFQVSAKSIQLGGDRPARLTKPSFYNSSKAYPLILFLHGYKASGSLFDAEFHASRDAKKLGYISLIPDGSPDSEGENFWNATPECCNFYGSERDDVSYLVNLIAEAKARFRISDVFIIGHSNGGFMANRMACERPDLFKGIVSIAGGLYRDAALCKNPGATDVLQIHGTQDTTIPYLSNKDYPGALETVQNWVTIQGCTMMSEQTAALDLIPVAVAQIPEGKETDALFYSGCKEGVRVALWTVNGGGHNNAFEGLVKNAMAYLTNPNR